MAEYTVNYELNVYDDRNIVRMAVVDELSKEKAGKGKGELASRYTYYVETLKDGSRIYLRRPASLHNGFDFVVCIENFNFNINGRKRNYPKHTDLIEDLRLKKSKEPKSYNTLYKHIEKIYMCKPLKENDYNIAFKYGYSAELILKALKWLFIEQDIRYWNYSGRDMLWKAINEI